MAKTRREFTAEFKREAVALWETSGRPQMEIAAELGCDSLAYLSLDGVYEAIRSTRETHCDACFSGDYPLARTDTANGKFALEELAVVRS